MAQMPTNVQIAEKATEPQTETSSTGRIAASTSSPQISLKKRAKAREGTSHLAFRGGSIWLTTTPVLRSS